MNTHTRRLALLALVPPAVAIFWFALPSAWDAAGRVFLIALLGSAILLAFAKRWGQVLDRAEQWSREFDHRSREAAPPVEFGTAAGKLHELAGILDDERRRVESSFESIMAQISALIANPVPKPTPDEPHRTTPEKIVVAISALDGHLQSLKSRLNIAQQVLMHSPVSILIFDSQGRLKSLNKHAEALIGVEWSTLSNIPVKEWLGFDRNSKDAASQSPVELAGAEGTATAKTPRGSVALRYAKRSLGSSGRETIFCLALWDRSGELEDRQRAVQEARSSAVQSVVRETLLAEIPLAEAMQAKTRLALGDVKQRAEKGVLIERISSVQRDIDRIAIRLRLWEWFYRTEWTTPPEPSVVEVAGSIMLNDCCRSMAGILESRKIQVNVVNRGGGWLCADADLLRISLLGLLTFATRVAIGGPLEVRIEKLPPSPDLAEGWISFTVSGDWNAAFWPAGDGGAQWEDLLRDSPAADGMLGFEVARRVALLMQGVCRTEQGPDGRNTVRLFLPTRLPASAILVADTEVGPREELCIGWKLGVAV